MRYQLGCSLPHGFVGNEYDLMATYAKSGDNIVDKRIKIDSRQVGRIFRAKSLSDC